MPIQEDARYYLKLKALEYYYNKNYTQTEIAKKLNISRVTLAKLLDEAKVEGMIKIEIVDIRNMKCLLEIEERLKQRFALRDVLLVDGDKLTEGEVTQRIASKGAEYFQLVLRSGMKIGVTWGRTLNAMVNRLEVNRRIRDLAVYTLVGSSSSNVNFQPNVLAQNLLNKYSGSLHILTAPFICGSPQLCSDIKAEPQIAKILQDSGSADITVVGLGEAPIEGEWSLGDYPFNRADIEELLACGAVGDICGNFFDIHGELCNTSIKPRIVSIDIRTLPQHKLVVGVGGGPKKVKSVFGALNGGYLDVLITDLQTAMGVLSLKEAELRKC